MFHSYVLITLLSICNVLFSFNPNLFQNIINNNNPCFNINKTVNIYLQINSPININQIDLTYNPSETFSFYQVPEGVTEYEMVSVIPYQILYDHHANDTERYRLVKILSDSIIYVFNINGFGVKQGTMQFDHSDPEVIINHNGDMVVKYAQFFYENDKISVMNLTNSSKYENEINKYFHESSFDIARTGTVIVLSEDTNLFYIRTQQVSIWKSPQGITIIIVIIILVLGSIIIAGACLHCRKRREDFETTLPKSKAHKQRVKELQKRKEFKKRNKKNIYAKYKAIKQRNTMETVEDDDETDIVIQTEPYNEKNKMSLEISTVSEQ